jgi:hypothetical protein
VMCLSRIKSLFGRPKAKVEPKPPERAAKAAGDGKVPGNREK